MALWFARKIDEQHEKRVSQLRFAQEHPLEQFLRTRKAPQEVRWATEFGGGHVRDFGSREFLEAHVEAKMAAALKRLEKISVEGHEEEAKEKVQHGPPNEPTGKQRGEHPDCQGHNGDPGQMVDFRCEREGREPCGQGHDCNAALHHHLAAG